MICTHRQRELQLCYRKRVVLTSKGQSVSVKQFKSLILPRVESRAYHSYQNTSLYEEDEEERVHEEGMEHLRHLIAQLVQGKDSTIVLFAAYRLLYLFHRNQYDCRNKDAEKERGISERFGKAEGWQA